MKITKEDIKALFKEYNKLYFDGVLPSCKCHVFKGRGVFGRYNYFRKGNGKYEGSIWIAYNVNWTEETLREVVVHEMIHHYVQTIEGRSGGLFGHNWRFHRQMRRLKKNYGLVIKVSGLLNEKKPANLYQRIRRFLGLKY